MCPLRFIFLFLSAAVAGFLAWRTIRSSSSSSMSTSRDEDLDEREIPSGGDSEKPRASGFKKVIRDGFWVFMDMSSGRYLWRAMKGQ